MYIPKLAYLQIAWGSAVS